MNTLNLSQRIEAAQNRRYAGIARMEDAQHKMEVAERNGQGADPRDAEAFEQSRQAVLAVDVELRDLQAQARTALGADGNVDVMAGSGMSGIPEALESGSSYARAFADAGSGRVDTAPLYRALMGSQDRTTGTIVLRTLLQGVAAGNLGRTTDNGGLTPVGLYGATPLVLAAQVVPTGGGIYYWQRIEAVTPPATGAVQATEGADKTQVELKSVPMSSTLATFAAFEKVSVQALSDQVGLLQAVDSLLTGAVLRAADAAAWTAFAAGSTAIVPDADDGIVTILKAAAKIATAGGTGIRCILSPDDWTTLVLQKASGAGTWMGLPPGVTLPAIVLSSGVPAGKVIVTAGQDGAFTAVRQSVEASIGLDGNDYTKNLRTVLCEGRMVSAVRNAEFTHAGDLVAA